MSDDAQERYLLEALADLQKSYQKAAKHYIDQLALVYASRPPAPVIIDAARFYELLAGRQQPLGDEFSEVLWKNAWDLYEKG